MGQPSNGFSRTAVEGLKGLGVPGSGFRVPGFGLRARICRLESNTAEENEEHHQQREGRGERIGVYQD